LHTLSLTCPPETSTLLSVMNTTSYGTQIVNALEEKGQSKDYIIGFMTATLNGLRFLENDQIAEYLKRTVKQTEEAM